jgi:hypothetical protein
MQVITALAIWNVRCWLICRFENLPAGTCVESPHFVLDFSF